jgi:hypothetical protein
MNLAGSVSNSGGNNMEKLTIRALVLAATIVAPNVVADATKPAPMKHVEEFTNDELRQTLRAMNCSTLLSTPAEELKKNG